MRQISKLFFRLRCIWVAGLGYYQLAWDLTSKHGGDATEMKACFGDGGTQLPSDLTGAPPWSLYRPHDGGNDDTTSAPPARRTPVLRAFQECLGFSDLIAVSCGLPEI